MIPMMRGSTEAADVVAVGATVKRMKPSQNLIRHNRRVARTMNGHTKRKRQSGEKNVSDIKASESVRTIQNQPCVVWLVQPSMLTANRV